MMNNFRYTNEKCPVCGETFTESREIVVCPLCGTPHHKECYSKNGECGNSEKHNEGFVWKPEAAPEEVQETQGNTNPYANANPYVHPHSFANANANDQMPPYGTPVPPQFVMGIPNLLNAFPPEIEDGISTEDAAAVIKNRPGVYLHKFFLIKSGKRTFNFCAFLFGGYWFIYRKMYKLGALFLAITLAVSAIPMFIPQYTQLESEISAITEEYGNDISADDPMGSLNEMYAKMGASNKKHPVGIAVISVQYAVNIALSLYFGFIADKKYKEHVVNKVREINSSEYTAGNDEFRKLRLFSEGGTTFGYTVLSIMAVNIISYALSSILTMLHIL